MVAESLVAGAMMQFLSFKELHMLGQRLGVSPSIFTRQLFQKLWQGNATLLLRRHHPGPLALDLHELTPFLFCCFFLFHLFVPFIVSSLLHLSVSGFVLLTMILVYSFLCLVRNIL